MLRPGADPVDAAGDAWTDLLTLEDVDRLLATTRAPAFRLVRDGAPLPRSASTRSGTVGGVSVDDLADPGRIYAAFEDGATVVLQGLNRTHPPVARLCRGLERRLTHPVQANAYLTPPSAAGLRVHHDTHDVFALQVHGRKRWVVHAAQVADPLPGQTWAGEPDTLASAEFDETLVPGDLLYLPRGTPHAARTVDAPSLHLTIGVRAVTGHDVLRRVLRMARDEPAFRAALPAGFARDREALAGLVAGLLEEFAGWVERLDETLLADRTADAFWSTRPPLLEGHLRTLVALDRVDDATRVSRRQDVTADLGERDGRLVLRLGDRTVRLPVRVRPAVEALLTADNLAVRDLREWLDGSGRLVLVRRMIREGLLRVASAGV